MSRASLPFFTAVTLPMSAPIPISKSEKSYIQTALRELSPIRADGRSLLDYRSIALETGIASLANGSARVNIGKTVGEEGGSGTEVIAAVKLEVENVLEGEGVDGGRVACTVSWFVSQFYLFPFAYSSLQSQFTSSISSSFLRCIG